MCVYTTHLYVHQAIEPERERGSVFVCVREYAAHTYIQQAIETWQYWEGLSALKEGLAAPLNFLRVRGDNAESSPDSSGRGRHDDSEPGDSPSVEEDAPGSMGMPGLHHGKGRESRRREEGKRRAEGSRGGPGVDKKGTVIGHDHVLKSPLIQLKYYDDLCGYIAGRV